MRKHLFYLLCLCIPLAGWGQLLNEGFEGTFPPSGWTVNQSNPNQTWKSMAGVSGWGTGKTVGVDYDPALIFQDEWLITPSIDLSDAEDALLTLAVGYSYYWAVDPNDNYDAYVKVSVDNGATWTKIWDGDDADPFEPPFQLISLSLPLTDFVGESNVKIAFQYYGVDGAGYYIDNVKVEAVTGGGGDPEYCTPETPTFNDSTGVTNVNFADLNNDTTGAGNYQDYTAMVANVEAGEIYPLAVKVDTQGNYYVNVRAWIDWNKDGIFDTSTEEYNLGLAQNVSNGATNLSPLDIEIPADASGNYRMRVRGAFGQTTVVTPCAAHNWSEAEDYTISVAGGEDPEPEYCMPEEPMFNDETGITNVNFANIDNNTTGDGTHQDYTSMVANVEAGESYPLSVKVDTQGNYYVNVRAWIDWNKDGVFDTSTEEYNLGLAQNVSNGATNLSPLDIEIPADASGNYRMRVRGAFGQTTVVTPCAAHNWSEAEDYTINVTEGGGEPGGPCDEKVVMECGETYTATLVPNAGEWIEYTDVNWDYTGSEQVFEFTAPTSGTYVFEVSEGDEDADFFLMDACSNTATNLSDGYWTGAGNESVALVGGTTYYLIADLYEGSEDPTTITVKVNCPNEPNPEGCLEADLDLPQWPTATFTPQCSGGPETIATNCWTGEYSKVAVTAGTEYTFTSSVNTDMITISNEAGTTVYAAGIASVTWTATETAIIRFYLHLDEDCDWGDDVNRSRIVQCGEVVEPSDYCEPVLDCTDGDLITNVTFQEINNNSNCGTNGYSDYTSMVATVEAGGTYPISVTVGSGWTYESTMVWIDFNNNFTFDPSEYYFVGSDPGTTNTADITIPAGTPDGTYRMRVRVGAVNPDLNDLSIMACDEDTVYGEVEDYTIVVGEGGIPECEQTFTGVHNTGAGFINNGTDVYVVANDVNVPAGSMFTVESIVLDVVTLGGAPTTFDVTFYSDNDGVGEQVGNAHTALTPSSITPNGTFGSTGYPVYSVEITLPEGQLLQAEETEGAKYWIALSGAPSATGNNVYWVSYLYEDNADSEPSWQSADGGASWDVFYNSNNERVEGIMTARGTCETLGINELTDFDFAYYPNPVRDVLNISTDKTVKDISVYNLAGQMVMKQASLNNGQVDVNRLTPGTYVFRVVLEGGQVESFKIIKK